MNRKKNLTKIDIAKTINKKKGLSVLISKKILDQYLEILTKKEHIISARKSLKFIASKNLLNKLNSKCG